MCAENCPVTLMLQTDAVQKELIGFFKDRPEFSLIEPNGSGPGGLVVFEIGPDADQDLQRLKALIGSSGVSEVFLTSKIKDPEMLIRAMQAGVKEFLPQPLDADELSKALERFSLRKQGSPDKEEAKPKSKGRIIQVFGGKGGVGSTTIAVNTAVELSCLGTGSTALLDMHVPMGEIPLFLDFEHAYTWGEAVRNISRLDAAFLMGIMTRHESGLYVLPAPDRLEDQTVASPEAATRLLAQMREVFDTVVIDGSHYLDELSLKIMEAADEILLVTVLSLPCLANVKKLLKAFEKIESLDQNKIKMVVNRYLSKSEITRSEAEELLAKKVFWTIENDYQATLSAINQGRPLSTAAPKTRVAKSIARLARTLSSSAKTAEPKQGLLGRLLHRPGAREPQTVGSLS
ncbi:MAG: cobyrinic acid a,c-diamide synthase [Thermodesulfobacteriota bacterium]|nr:cobyrinic acid a,c-diamide synthase [Thermodesulfobacteriota bacterium]